MSHLELCRKAVETAQRLGAKEAEALIVGGHRLAAEIERGEIKTCSDVTDIGLAIRAISNGKMGFAYTNILTKEGVEKSAKQAFSASSASVQDRNWRQLAARERYPTVMKVYDKKILDVSSDEAVDFCRRMMIASAEVDKRVMPAFGGAEVSSQELACVNTKGVEVEDEGTVLVCALGTMARSETQVSPMCFEFKAARVYQPEPEWVGKQAARLAVDSLNVGKAEAGKFPVLFDPIALQDIFGFTFIESMKGDTVHRGRSKFKDKVGESMAAIDLNLYDDGTLEGGLYSGIADMEGVPRHNTPIVEKGMLQGFLYDNYWARLAGKESTGNAGRGGGGLNLPPYCTVPSIMPTNTVLKPGTASEQELLQEVRNGYYVRSVQGAHQSNPETGDFSVVMTPAWKIEKGELKHAVKGAMIAGNAYDMLKNLSLIGKDARQVGSLFAPKVVIGQVNVVTR